MIYWLPVLLWMGLIFSASSDRMSFQHSSRVIGPMLRWLFPHLSDASVHATIVCIRKSAHVTEYALLALLLWRGVRKGILTSHPRPWQWSDALWIALLVFFYAATDEFHQRFVSSRQASVGDVMLDTSGAILALLFLWALGRWRKRW